MYYIYKYLHRKVYVKLSIVLYNDDCMNVMGRIADKSVDMVLCDLPYGKLAGKTRASWDIDLDYDRLCEEYRRIIKDTGVICLHGNEPFSSILRLKMLDMYKYDIKWIKSKTTGFANANYRPMNKYEDIIVFSKANASAGGKNNSMTYNPQGLIPVNKSKTNTKNRHGIVMKDTNNIGENNSMMKEGTEYTQKYTGYPSNILYFDNPKKYVHPTQKPVELLEYLIKTYTNQNDTVLDNCMGSGSTGVACKNTNRNFIGVELNEEYFKIASDRINTDDCRVDISHETDRSLITRGHTDLW